MKKLLPIFLLFIYSTAFGAYPDTIEITTAMLPYSIVQDSTTYKLTGNITSATNGIYIAGYSSDSIEIIGNNDTLFFGTGDGNSNYGIRIFGDGSDQCHHILVKDLTIYHNPSDSTVTDNHCVRMSGGSNILFDNVNLYLQGYGTTAGSGAHLVYSSGGAYGLWNVEFNGGTWTSDVTSYESRCNYDGAACVLTANLSHSLVGDEYNYKIDSLTLTQSPGQGISIAGKSFVFGNTITIDARNDQYTYPSGNYCHSSTNSFAILTQQLEAGSYIKSNIIRAGASYAGCDGGVLLQMSRGTSADPVEICDNDIDIHRGKDAYYLNLNAKPFKSRYANDWAYIHDNIFKATVGDTAASSYGPKCMGVDLVSWHDAGCDWAEGKFPDSGLVYKNNTIIIVALDSLFDEAMGARIAVTDSLGCTWVGYECEWENNHITTPMWGYQLSGYDGTCDDFLIEGDTIAFADSSWDNKDLFSYRLGYVGSGMDNVSLDCIYEDGATDTAISFLNNEGNRSIYLKRTVIVQVMGNNSLPVSGASVWAINNYGDTAFSGTTPANGQVSGVAKYWYEAEDTGDSLVFNDFTLKTKLATDSTTITNFTAGWTTAGGLDTLTLSATAGANPGVGTQITGKLRISGKVEL